MTNPNKRDEGVAHDIHEDRVIPLRTLQILAAYRHEITAELLKPFEELLARWEQRGVIIHTSELREAIRRAKEGT